MNRNEAEALVRGCLGEVAPESSFADVPSDADYRDLLALDSLDFLRLVELLSSRSGIRIEESDYPKLATIASAADYVVTS